MCPVVITLQQLSPQGRASIDMPSDAQRISLVRHIIEAGFSHRMLISQDIHSKHRMVRTTVLVLQLPSIRYSGTRLYIERWLQCWHPQKPGAPTIIYIIGSIPLLANGYRRALN